MLQIGDILDGRYEILEQIGSGGTGIVYRAYHHGLRKYVVVKKIKDRFSGSMNGRVEVDILKNLHHPYLPQVFDFIQSGDQIFTVMDYIEGYDLEFYRSQGYVFGERQLRNWLSQLLQVLDYLHSQCPPIIHSDIKPANIMIDSNGNVCLIDFNVSLDSDEAKVMGVSPQYAAPEQMELYLALKRGEHIPKGRIDARTDIYSLGLTFYEMMTGIAPNVVREEMIPLPEAQRGYSSALIGVIQKAMNPAKEHRYQSAAKMLKAVEHLEKRPSEKLERTNRILTAGYLLCLVLTVWLCAYGVRESRREALWAECGQLEEAYRDYDSLAVKTLGGGILEEKKYRPQLQREAERKADILHAVGDAYFWEENYEEAVSYYMEAVNLLPEGTKAAVYYRDAAIGLARAGRLAEAETLLANAQSRGASDNMLLLARGEIESGAGNPEAALEYFEMIVQGSTEPELLYRCYMDMAETYGHMDNGRGQVQAIEEANAIQENRMTLRKLGLACSAYAQQADAQTAWEMNQRALECFQKLVCMDDPLYEDRMNYALLCEKCEKYEEALGTLEALAQERPDDYVISKRICTLLYHMELKKEASGRSYDRMMDYYRLAWRQYQAVAATGVSDEEMMELKQVADRIEGGG